MNGYVVVQDKPMTILVVDDEKAICEGMQEEFEESGFRVLTANCGEEAFDIICNDEVDVVISDVKMPNGDGVWLLKSIQNSPEHNPIFFFMSAYSDLSVQDSYDKGAVALLPKPVDLEVLIELVRMSIFPKNRGWPRKTSAWRFILKKLIFAF